MEENEKRFRGRGRRNRYRGRAFGLQRTDAEVNKAQHNRNNILIIGPNLKLYIIAYNIVLGTSETREC